MVVASVVSILAEALSALNTIPRSPSTSFLIIVKL